MKNSVGVLLIILGLYACQPSDVPIVEKAKVDTFYDLHGLISSIAKTLNQSKPQVIKKVSIDGRQEEYVGNEIDWEKELTLFKEADINKPTLISQYLIDSTSTESAMYTVGYRLIDDTETGVVSMRIVSAKPGAPPLIVSIKTKKNNALFYGDTYLRIEMQDSLHLKSYFIEGVEKVVLKDTLKYTISGSLQ